MEYKEVRKYLENTQCSNHVKNADNMRKLLSLLGNPQEKKKYILISGTNGKGSISATLASVMKSCGLKTGLYTKQHLFDYNERIQVNGHNIDDDTFAQLITKIKSVAESMEEYPSYSEILTACALLWFEVEKVNVVVIQTDDNGYDDIAEIIDAPEVAVIANIVTESENTAESLAANESRIIKNGCSCVSYEQNPYIRKILEDKCASTNSEIQFADNSQLAVEFDMIEGQVFTYKKNPYAIPLLGAHQRKNAAVVLETVEVLRKKGWELDQSDVEHGLYAVSWPGCFEIVSDEPFFVVNKSKNLQSAETAVECLNNYFPDMNKILLVGMFSDDDSTKIADIIAATATEFVCVVPERSEYMSAGEVTEMFYKYGKQVTLCSSEKEGVAAAQDIAQEHNGMVCAIGSSGMIGKIRTCFNLY